MANETTKTASGKKPLSKTLKRFYGVGSIGFGWMTNIETYYFQYFLTDVAKFNSTMATTIATIASTIDAVLSWIYGVILNTVKPMRWGRYRSWLVAVPWIVPFLYTFQFLKIGDGAAAAAIIVLGAATSHIAWNIPYVANATMVSVAASTPEDRMALSSNNFTYSYLGRLTYSYVGPYAAMFFSNVLGEQYGYAATAFAFAALMAALYFAHFKMFDGYEVSEVEVAGQANQAQEKKKKGSGLSGKDMLVALFKNPPLLVLLICEFGTSGYNFVVAGMTAYYFKYVVENETLTSPYILVTTILAFVGAYTSRYVAKALSIRKTYLLSALLCTVGPLLAYFVTGGNLILVMITMSIGQLGIGLKGGLTSAMYADIIIYNEWKTGKNAAGFIMGMQNVPIKVGVVIKSLLIGFAMGTIGGFIDADTVLQTGITPQLQEGVLVGFMLIPAILTAVSFILYLVGYHITPEKIAKYQAEIDARKQKA